VTDQPQVERYADDAGRYRLDGRLATGGMGEVWRGTDTTLGRRVAVKLLKDEYADNPSFRARFETEARHAASLHHANIAAVYDFGDAAPADGSHTRKPYLVMELVDGQPLSALLRPGEPMDPDAVRGLLTQAAEGLGAAHAAGIVHRDVKPANLLITPAREVKVTDFGIARAADGIGLTQTGEVMGTPQYLSPEQAQGGVATPASDVYSLGVVAFECLAGRRPFVADSAVATALAHLREPVPPLPDDVPHDLAAVVRRAMSKLPQDRFRNGGAFAAALRDPATAVLGATALTGAAAAAAAAAAEPEPTQVLGTGTVVPPTPAPRPGPVAVAPAADRAVRRRNGLLPVLVVLAVAVLAVLAAYLFLGRGGADQPADKVRRHTHAPSASTASTASTTPTSQAPATPSSSPAPTRSSAPPSSAAPSSTAPTPSAPTSAATSPTAPATSGGSAPVASEPASQTASQPASQPTAPAASAPAGSAPAGTGSGAATPRAGVPARSSSHGPDRPRTTSTHPGSPSEVPQR
jgi:serine/threonine-protein kinase